MIQTGGGAELKQVFGKDSIKKFLVCLQVTVGVRVTPAFCYLLKK